MPGRELPDTAKAVAEVLKGAPYYATAKKWGISPSSLYRAVKRRNNGKAKNRSGNGN